MSKILMISGLLYVLAVLSPLSAQEIKKHDLTIGLGISGGEMPKKVLKDIVNETLNSEHNFSTDDKKRSGFYLSYKYRFNQRWSAGTTLNYKQLTEKKASNAIDAKYSQNFYGLNLEAQYYYLNKTYFRMYILGGVGIYTCKESLRKIKNANKDRTTDHTTSFTYQISPLCFEVGTDLGLRMEYGYGYKGIGSIGVYTRF